MCQLRARSEVEKKKLSVCAAEDLGTKDIIRPSVGHKIIQTQWHKITPC